jgi:hypothetical protein
MPPVMKEIKTKADNSIKSFFATLIYYSNPYSLSLRTGIRRFILVRLSCLPLLTANSIFSLLKVNSSIVLCALPSLKRYKIYSADAHV